MRLTAEVMNKRVRTYGMSSANNLSLRGVDSINAYLVVHHGFSRVKTKQ